jgi:hypothetical protein
MVRPREAVGARVQACYLVHRSDRGAPKTTVVAPGMAALDVAKPVARLVPE